MSEPKFYWTKKDLAAAIGRNPRFIRDCELGGLVLPCTIEEVVFFVRNSPFPSRFRKKKKS